MKIAIFGRTFNPDFSGSIIEFFKGVEENKIQAFIFSPFYDFICNATDYTPEHKTLYNVAEDIPQDVDFMVSIGGDGTFLESITYLRKFDIPVIGINSGRLGYLANIARGEISEALSTIIKGHYELEKRTLLTVESTVPVFGKHNFALNDITIQKKDTNMITVDAFLNDDYLNTYWTDGIIIATPTGSTAYCLSVGGPIVLPGAGNFVIAPIASHNLTVRPLVIPDNMEMRLEVKSRSGVFQISADSRTQLLDCGQSTLYIRKAAFQIKMVKLPFNSYYGTLRSKLMWGADIRN